MNLLFVSGVYVPASGGSELSAHTLLTELAKRGHRVQVLTKQKPNAELGLDDDIAVTRCAEEDLAPTFHSIARAFHPNAVLTQLVWSERVLLWSRQLGLPTVLFARSADGEIDLSLKSPYAPTAVVANAGVTQEYVRWA